MWDNLLFGNQIIRVAHFFFSPRENKLSETGIGYFVLGTYQSYEEILKIETGYILAEMISLYWKFKKKKSLNFQDA